MKARILAVVIVSVAMLGVTRVASAQDLAAKGAELYATHKCSTCHSVAGKGNAKGPMEGVGSKYTADELRQWLVDPAAMTAKVNAARKPPMKSYKSLSKEDLDALVAYMQTFKKK